MTANLAGFVAEDGIGIVGGRRAAYSPDVGLALVQLVWYFAQPSRMCCEAISVNCCSAK